MRIDAARPDLLITGLRMPGIDSFEMLRASKVAGALARVDIIVDTALTEHTIADVADCRAASRSFTSRCDSPMSFGSTSPSSSSAGAAPPPSEPGQRDSRPFCRAI